MFLPSVPGLLQLAGELELQRDHVLGRPVGDDDLWAAENALLASAQAEHDGPGGDEQFAFEALESAATFDRVLFDGGEFGTTAAPGSAEEEDFLGLPGLVLFKVVSTMDSMVGYKTPRYLQFGVKLYF